MCVLLLLHLQTTFFFHCDTLLAVFRYFRGWFVRRMLEKSKAKVIISKNVTKWFLFVISFSGWKSLNKLPRSICHDEHLLPKNTSWRVLTSISVLIFHYFLGEKSKKASIP